MFPIFSLALEACAVFHPIWTALPSVSAGGGARNKRLNEVGKSVSRAVEQA